MPNNIFIDGPQDFEGDSRIRQWMLAALMVAMVALLVYSIVMTSLDPML